MKNKRNIGRFLLMAALDIVIIISCGYITMLTRYGPQIPAEYIEDTNSGLINLVVSYISVFAIFGMYKVRWRAMTMPLLFRQALGCVVGMGVSLVWDELIKGSAPRRYYLIIAFAFILGGICGFRLIMKLIRDFMAARHGETAETRTGMTISAGENESGLLINVAGVTIKGSLNDIDSIASEKGVSEILICLSSADTEFMQELTNICLSTGCSVKKI